jgi:hypothetical protein
VTLEEAQRQHQIALEAYRANPCGETSQECLDAYEALCGLWVVHEAERLTRQ